MDDVAVAIGLVTIVAVICTLGCAVEYAICWWLDRRR